MMIISKHKDYYDYLSGIWGVDPKIVLERKYGVEIQHPTDGEIFTYIIGGKLIQIFYKDGKSYFGEDIKKFDVSNKWNRKENFFLVETGDLRRKPTNYIASNILDGYEYLNMKYKSPILFRKDNWNIDLNNSNFIKSPILSSTDLPKFISPETVYKMISDYISSQITKKENNIVDIDNSIKIQNKGFDPKKSFRPKMKFL